MYSQDCNRNFHHQLLLFTGFLLRTGNSVQPPAQPCSQTQEVKSAQGCVDYFQVVCGYAPMSVFMSRDRATYPSLLQKSLSKARQSSSPNFIRGTGNHFQANKKVLAGILFQLPINTALEEVKSAPCQLCGDRRAGCVRIPEQLASWLARVGFSLKQNCFQVKTAARARWLEQKVRVD